jgi:hypothetical protein
MTTQQDKTIVKLDLICHETTREEKIDSIAEEFVIVMMNIVVL